MSTYDIGDDTLTDADISAGPLNAAISAGAIDNSKLKAASVIGGPFVVLRRS